MNLNPLRAQLKQATTYPNKRTLKDISTVSGVDYYHLSRIMNGHIDTIGMRTAELLMDALGCSIQDIIGSDKDDN